MNADPLYSTTRQLHEASQVVEEILVRISLKCVNLKGPDSKGVFPFFVTLEDFASMASTHEFE
jgi:hypothetical protein